MPVPILNLIETQGLYDQKLVEETNVQIGNVDPYDTLLETDDSYNQFF